MPDFHAVAAVRSWQGKGKPRGARLPRMRGRSPHYTLVFDTETTVDASQSLRVGCYRILDRTSLVEEGLFHAAVSDDELRLVTEYAAEHELRLLSVDEFRDLLFHYGYRLRSRIVGLNLPGVPPL